MASTSKETLDIRLEFGGGTELLLAPPRSKKQRISLPARADPATLTKTMRQQPVVTTPAADGGANEAAAGKEEARPADMRYLVQWIRNHLIVEREELFVDAEGEGVRPGILVLINDADWELEGELEYQLQDGDEVCFISTLHGG